MGGSSPTHPQDLKGTAHYIAPKRRVSIEVKRCFLSLSFRGLRFAQLPIRKSEHKPQLANASKLLTSRNTEELPPKVFFKKNLVVTLLIGSFVITLYRLCIYNFSFTELSRIERLTYGLA